MKYTRRFNSVNDATSAQDLVSPNLTTIDTSTGTKLLMKNVGTDVPLEIKEVGGEVVIEKKPTTETWVFNSPKLILDVSMLEFTDTPWNNCFIAGTHITMANRDIKNIEDIIIGDEILSYNPETCENYVSMVKKTIIHENTTTLARITLENNSIIEMNEYHPILTKNGWHSITKYNNYDKLVIDDEVKTIDGYSKIINIECWISEPITTYDLDVVDKSDMKDKEYDNYFANGICAHNPAARYEYANIDANFSCHNINYNGFYFEKCITYTTKTPEREAELDMYYGTLLQAYILDIACLPYIFQNTFQDIKYMTITLAEPAQEGTTLYNFLSANATKQ